jgi:hypothetical protein
LRTLASHFKQVNNAKPLTPDDVSFVNTIFNKASKQHLDGTSLAKGFLLAAQLTSGISRE